jgi:hypothetical protein
MVDDRRDRTASSREHGRAHLCGTDAVATLPLYIHETHGHSCDHEDAIDAKWHREDAIAATTSS